MEAVNDMTSHKNESTIIVLNRIQRLLDMVSEKIVKVPLVSKDKPDVLRELVQILKDAGEIDDLNAVLKVVQEREHKQSTGLERGIAVPHGKTAAISSMKLAIGIAPQGIDFYSLDGKLSKLFFLLVAPSNQSGPHVQALAEIVKIIRSQAFCEALVHAENAREVVKLMKGEYMFSSRYRIEISGWAQAS